MKQEEFISIILPLRDRSFRIALQIVRNREEAEDIVQDMMLKMWKMEGGLDMIGCIDAYCYTMVRNLALNRFALKGGRNEELKSDYVDASSINQPHESVVRSDRLDILYDLIAGLPDQQRYIVQLRDVEGMSYLEIADQLQISEEQVKIDLFRARKKIKELFLRLENYGLRKD